MLNAILIEDDLFYRTKIIYLLDQIGVTVLGIAENNSSAIKLLTEFKPNIIIADVMLGTERVYEIFNSQSDFCYIPTLFLTSSKSETDFKNAKKVVNHLYVIKPIHPITLRSALEKLCGNLRNSNTKTTTNSLLIKGKFNQKISLPFDKIIYISQTQHYSTIYTQKQNFVIKKSLVNTIKLLDHRFMQSHRSYCVNTDFIKNFGIGLESIKINDIEIPIGLKFKDAVKKLIAEKFSIM
jgi:hypothetical protein